MKAHFSRIQIISAAILCILLGISVLFGKTAASSEQFHQKNLDYLESKRENAKALSGAASASSLLISLIPDDAGTPVANQISNLGTHFLIILSALTAEQKLLTITGEISFCWLVPFAIIFLLFFVFLQRKLFLQMGVKLLICAIAIFTVVPLTIQITRMADSTYQETVENTLEQSKELEDTIQSSALYKKKASALSESDLQEELSTSGQNGITTESALTAAGSMTETLTSENASTETVTENDSQPSSVPDTEGTEAFESSEEKTTEKASKKKHWYVNAWDTISGAADTVSNTAHNAITGISEFADSAADTLGHAADSAADFAENAAGHISDAASTVSDTVISVTDSTVSFFQNIPELPEKAAELLDSFTESFVIMMVTTCVLPIFVLFGCVWILNMLLSIDPDWDGMKLFRSARKS